MINLVPWWDPPTDFLKLLFVILCLLYLSFLILRQANTQVWSRAALAAHWSASCFKKRNFLVFRLRLARKGFPLLGFTKRDPTASMLRRESEKGIPKKKKGNCPYQKERGNPKTAERQTTSQKAKFQLLELLLCAIEKSCHCKLPLAPLLSHLHYWTNMASWNYHGGPWRDPCQSRHGLWYRKRIGRNDTTAQQHSQLGQQGNLQ